VAKQKAHKAVQIARDALSDIKLYWYDHTL
jgi:hypothetical protein